MPPQSREEINRRYQNDLEAANAWRESDPERYAREVAAAQDRRFTALDELATAAEAEGAASKLTAARVQAHAQFPLAPEEMIAGATPEEIVASAEKLHKLLEKNRREAEDAARAESRATRAAAYQRAGGVPASADRPQGEPRAAEQAQAAVDRLNAMTAESGKNGDKRDPTKILTVEDTLGAMRESGKTDALIGIMTGEAQRGKPENRLSDEDLRG